MDYSRLLAVAALLAGTSGFAQSPVSFEYKAPAAEYKAPATVESGWMKGQVPNVGGALQYYLNVGRTYTLHDVMPPFAWSFSHPMAHGRIELFGSAAGIYVPFATALTRQNAWLTQASLGARVALDPAHRFWLGTTAWYLTDFADKKRQRGYESADFTFQFGR